MEATPRRMVAVTETEAMRLLGAAKLGRVVFTERAMPAIRPVNHVVDSGHIVIRGYPGAAIVLAARDTEVVAYEADDIDPQTWSGWSVIVTGIARPVWDAAQIARYDRLLVPWAAGDKNSFIRITPELVTGYRLE